MRRVGPPRLRVTSKIRRTRVQAYGNISSWYAIVKEVLVRDKYKCRDCGRAVGGSTGVSYHTHHITPVSRGGQTVSYNLKTVCVNCHERKPFHGHMR